MQGSTVNISFPIHENILSILNETKDEFVKNILFYTALYLYRKNRLTVSKASELSVEFIERLIKESEIEDAEIAELYRSDGITFNQAHNLLKSSSWKETANILEKYGCELYYDKVDFASDVKTLKEFNEAELIKHTKSDFRKYIGYLGNGENKNPDSIINDLRGEFSEICY